MQFECDPNKSLLNEAKHGVSLWYGSEIWNGPVYTARSKRRHENRKLSIGKIAGEYWTVIWEDKSESIRLISARLSTMSERSLYDKHVN